MALLEARSLTKRFGGLVALQGLDLDVHKGEILGLIGPNGAGKSTVFNIITGFASPSEGRITFEGQDITGLKPHVIARKGIARCFQHECLWQDFSVMETMRVASDMHSGASFLGMVFGTASARKVMQIVDEKAIELLRSVGMDQVKHQRAGSLSHGYQRSLSLAIAAATAPTLLLMDEPLAALNPQRVDVLVDWTRRQRDAGMTVVMVEHNMRAIFKVCDRIVVIDHGTKIAEGTPSQVRDDPVVISAYLGMKKDVT